MLRLVSLAVWWALLVCTWAIFVGTTTKLEILFGLAAASFATVVIEVVRAQGLLNYRLERPSIVQAWKAPAAIVYDFFLVGWLLVRALARGRRVEGRLLTVEYAAGGARPHERFRRSWATTIGTMSPNVIVVDVDADASSMTLHTLDPSRWTGRSAL